MDKTTNVYFPKWASILYSALALVLVPWIFNLAQNLPTRHVVRHWDAVWVGFDIIMLIAMAITIWFVIKKRIWVVISATALATLFVVDAWFDILTSRPGRQQTKAIIFGAMEIGLAVLTYRLVYVIIVRSTTQKQVRIVPRDS
jgi:hypothetical protein